MSTSVNANINVIVNTSQAVAQLRSLQAQVAATNKGLAASSGAAVAQQASLNKAFMDSANASRMWNARIVPMTTATERFSQSIDRGKLSLGQYSRYAASQLPGMSRVFKREFDMMSRVAQQNVRRMQTQYVSLGTSASGAAQAMALTPTHLNKMNAATAMATQRQVLMNRMIDLGSTKLLNWGKNTQWAGRQLMVGFSLPLAMMGTVAAKTFKQIDQSEISFKRVYGNLSTTTAEMERNLKAVKDLGMEYTKYGKSLSETIELAAKVAATGAQGESLTAATEQTIRLATLGLMEYDEALGATIALQTAFGVSNEDLASTIDFLNVAENETILTMQDMAAAIPRVAPVVKGLGGDIKDLAVMMTAMREGGVTAEQGANAIKSGLARLINPTKAAREQMEKFGISIDAIIQKNRGDLMGTIQDFGQALATLDDFEQQQSLEKVFGKYQYARLGALFKNIVKDGSQAQRTIDLTAMSVEDLAKISDRELSKIEEATSTKFAASMERLKVSIAPVGEIFMKSLMPIIDFVAKIANAFNDLSPGIKSAIAISIGAIAGIGPIVLMTIGLIANGIANVAKLMQTMRKFFARLKGDSSAFQYLTAEEQEARGAADALSGATERLTGKFLGQRKALDGLVGMLGTYSKALGATAMAAPMMMGVGRAAGAKSIVSGTASKSIVTRGYAKGVTSVPGTGNKDTIPALLTPGESVITKEATSKYSPILEAMNAGTIPGFAFGDISIGDGPGQRVVPMNAFGPQGIENIQAQVQPVITELVDSGMDLAKAITTVADLLEAKQREFMTAEGKMGAVPPSKVAQAIKDAGFAPAKAPLPLASGHITPSIPSSDTRVQEIFQTDKSGAVQGKRVLAGLYPDNVSAKTGMTAGFDQGTNISLRSGTATEQQVSGISNRSMLPALARVDPTMLNDSEAIAASDSMMSEIKERALVISAGTQNIGVHDDDLSLATSELVASLRARADRGELSGGELKALGATEKAIANISEIRAGGTNEFVQKGMDSGELVREGTSIVPNTTNARVLEQISATGMTVEEYSALPPSSRQIARLEEVAGVEKMRPAGSAGVSTDQGVAKGRPKASLTEAQEQRVSDAFNGSAREAVGAASPATSGTELVDDYVDGMKVGVNQNLTELDQLGTKTAKTYDQAIKETIASGGRTPPPDINNFPAGGADDPDRPESDAAKQAKEIKKQINDANSVAIKEKSQIAKNVRGISKEVGSMFRLVPQTAYEIARNFKESGKIVGSIISQIAAPYTRPIVNAFKFLRDTVVGNIKMAASLILNDIKKIPTILKGAVDKFTAKVKGSYEMLALRTSVAMDSIKSLPSKVKSAYETAALKTMMALDSIKKLPDTMKRKATELQNKFNNFRADLPQKIMGARNKAFYNAQDALGRGKQALGGLKERFAGVRERLSASNKYAAESLREGSLRSAARSYVPDSAAASAKKVSEQITKAATNVKTQLTEAGKNVANSAKLAKILLKDGDTRGAIRAMTPDKIAQAFNAAVKPIANAANVVYGKMVDGAKVIGGKISDAAGTVSRKFNEAAGKITAAGKNLVNSVNVAGRALAARDLKTALRSLTPDKVANALGSAKVRAGEMYGSAKERVTAVASQAKATGITAYNALLAKDVKTFIKALTPDRVWEAGKKLATSISGTAQRVATAGKLAYDTIIFNAKAAIALGPGIIKDGFNFVRSSLIQGANFIKDTITVNVRAALAVGASEIKQAFVKTKLFIIKSGKEMYESVKYNLFSVLLKTKKEIYRIGEILSTEGPKLRKSLRGAVEGVVGAVKGSGKILADSIRAVGGMVRATGASVAQGMKGFLQGGVSEKTGQNRGQRIAGSGNGAMMGLMGISMAASMLPGQLGEMSQKIMPVTMGLMGLQMILPMLTNPLGLAIIATTALVGGFIYLRKQLDDTAKEAANLGANLGGIANGMSIVEGATGFKAPDLEDRLFRFSDEDRKAMAEFESYFESDAGSKFVEELKEATSEERYQKISYLLAQGIAAGLDQEKAKAFGKAIAEATGDTLLSSSLTKDFARGFFKEGSQALIDLVGSRLKMAPEMGLVSEGRKARAGESSLSHEKRIRSEAYQGLSLWQEAIDAPLAIMSSLGGMLRGRGKQDLFMPFTEGKMEEQLVAESAKGLGFVLQMLQDITNAEAILAEERRSGVIQYQEAEGREAELKALRDETESYFRTVIENGADSGAMLQAFGDQLSFRDFNADQITRITETFSPDALAERFFGADYKELDDAQKKYVDEVFSKTMSGLNPDNVSQRLQDIEGRWSEIANSVVNAIRNGADIDVGAAFSEASFRQALSGRTGVGRQTAGLQEEGGQLEEQKVLLEAEMDSLLDKSIEAQKEGNRELASVLTNQRNEVVKEWKSVSERIKDVYSELSEIDPSSSISKNLTGAEEELEKLGLTTEEVAARFLEFTDDDFVKELGSSEDGFVRLGKAIKVLGDYEKIDIELVLKQNIDPNEVVSVIERINDIKINKKVFGTDALDAASLTNSFMGILDDLEISLNDVPGLVEKNVEISAKKIKALSKDAFNELGNIKISPKVVANIFGTDEETSRGLSNALKSSFPKDLPPTILPIYLSLMNADLLVALSKLSPEAKAAIEAGAIEGQSVVIAAGSPFARSYELTPNDIAAYNNDKAAKDMAKAFLPKGTTETEDDDKKRGGGGSEKEKTALEELEESIAERTALYLGITKQGQKLDKSKKGYLKKLAAQTTTNNSIAGQLRKLNLSETIVGDILSKGSEKASEIIKTLGSKGLKKINIAGVVSNAGQFIDNKKGEVKRAEYKKTAKASLEKTGKFSEKEIENILEDEQATEIIAMLPKRFTGLWEQLIRSLRKTADATAEVVDETEKLEDAFNKAQEVFNQTKDLMDQGFDDAEQTKRDGLAASFLEKNGQTVTEMERQVVLNQRLVDLEQDKIDKKQEQINDYQRETDIIQQGIDNQKRQDEIRNRVSAALSYDLDQIGVAEQDIRDAYDKRIKSLEKVESINQRIIEQQKGQLGLAQALSEGDMYAAAQAAQEMRAADAQFAMQNTKDAMQTSMENQIDSLTNADGLTRKEIEAQIQSIKEQSYQASLMIRIEEDKIYATSLKIRDLTNEIYNINEDLIEPLQNKNKEFERSLSLYAQEEEYAIKNLVLAGMTREEWNKKADALQRNIDNAERLDPWLKSLIGDYLALEKAARAAADQAARLGGDLSSKKGVANKPDYISSATSAANSAGGMDYSNMDFSGMDFSGMDFSGMDFSGLNLGFASGGIMKYAKGGIAGNGSRDSVPAMLTPGEFVVRKSMVEKYGAPMLKAINQGSFVMPKYSSGPDTPSISSKGGASTSINAPVYNNFSVSVSATTNANADDIANKAVVKIKQMQNMQVRSNRG